MSTDAMFWQHICVRSTRRSHCTSETRDLYIQGTCFLCVSMDLVHEHDQNRINEGCDSFISLSLFFPPLVEAQSRTYRFCDSMRMCYHCPCACEEHHHHHHYHSLDDISTDPSLRNVSENDLIRNKRLFFFFFFFDFFLLPLPCNLFASRREEKSRR